MVRKIYTPWDLDTVKALKLRQADDTKHAYTCEDHSSVKLVPIYSGWVCIIPSCDYTQNWALDIDVDDYGYSMWKDVPTPIERDK